jgi:hypothetical protein
MSLLPREHGAYGQIAFPLVTSFAVAGVSGPAVLVALAAIAGFLAHEPLLVFLGARGVRARREQSRPAAVWLIVTSVIAVGAGLVALWSAPTSIRWSFLLPLLPAVFLAAAIGAKREKSSQGEVAVALAFSLLAVPVCLAAGASVGTALAVGSAFASIFVTGTLGVRVVVLKVRRGGNPEAGRSTRITVVALTSAAGVGLAAAALVAALPWAALTAAAPGLAAAAWIAMFPPAPTRLRTVGWTLVATAAAAALILLAGLARQS